MESTIQQDAAALLKSTMELVAQKLRKAGLPEPFPEECHTHPEASGEEIQGAVLVCALEGGSSLLLTSGKRLIHYHGRARYGSDDRKGGRGRHVSLGDSIRIYGEMWQRVAPEGAGLFHGPAMEAWLDLVAAAVPRSRDELFVALLAQVPQDKAAAIAEILSKP